MVTDSNECDNLSLSLKKILSTSEEKKKTIEIEIKIASMFNCSSNRIQLFVISHRFEFHVRTKRETFCRTMADFERDEGKGRA